MKKFTFALLFLTLACPLHAGTFEWPDELTVRIAESFGYQPEITAVGKNGSGQDILITAPNPESRDAFIQRVLKGFLLGNIPAYESRKAAAAEEKRVFDDVKSEIESVQGVKAGGAR